MFSLQILEYIDLYDMNSKSNPRAEIQITTHHFEIWKLKMWTHKYLQIYTSTKLKPQFLHPQNVFLLQIIERMDLYDMNSMSNRIAEIPIAMYHFEIWKLKMWTRKYFQFLTSTTLKQQFLHPQNIFSLQIIEHMDLYDMNSMSIWIA